MKKFLFTLFLFFSSLILFSCNLLSENKSCDEHNFVAIPEEKYLASEATCQTPATYYYSCANCETLDTRTFEYGDVASHNFVEIINDNCIASPATCQTLATYYYSCECGKINYHKTFSGGTLGAHFYQFCIEDEKYLRTEGTCQYPATYYLSCECGDFSQEYYFTANHNEPHNFTEQDISNQYLCSKATCQTPATYYYSCKCGMMSDKSFEYGPVSSHKYEMEVASETYLKSEANCKYPATYYLSCKFCGEKGTNTFTTGNTLPHDCIEEDKTSYFGTPYVYIECKHCDYFDFVYQDRYLLTEFKKYSSTSMFDSFDELENSKQLKNMYLDILANSLIFTIDSTIDLPSDVLFIVDYSAYNLSLEEGATVWSAIESDWPLFYWLDNNIYASDTIVYMTIEDYRLGANRQSYNELIFSGIENILNKLENLSTYEQLFYLHDEIVSNTNYAYDENGLPSEKLSAHSIHGYFNNENVVCEGYAKTAQLIMNALGIENIYVTGDAGEPHAWNIVNLYGEWYLLDLTWDDADPYQYSLYYFLVRDYGTHIPSSSELGFYYQPSLPELSSNHFFPVTLYKDDMFLGVYGYLDAALSQINDENGTYTIYLYDENITEYESYMDCSFGLTKNNMPICKSITFIGHTNSTVDFLFTEDEENILTCDIYLKNISFPDPSFPGNWNINIRNINLNNHQLTIDNCSGGFYYHIYGGESSQINTYNCNGPLNVDCIMFLGLIDVDKYYSMRSDASIQAHFKANHVTLENAVLSLESLTEEIIDIDILIENLILDNGSIYIRYNTNAYGHNVCGIFNITINKLKGLNETDAASINLYYSDNWNTDGYYPYPNIVINESNINYFDFYIFNFSLDKFMEVKDKLLTLKGNTKISLLCFDINLNETLHVDDDGIVSSSLEYKDGFLMVKDVLYKYLLDELFVEIPDNITTIKSNCFNKKSMVSLTIPESLSSVECDFISQCLNLNEIINNSSISDEHLLDNIPYDTRQTVEFVNESRLKIEGDFIFSEKNNELIIIKYLGSDTEVILPTLDTPYVIGPSLFFNNKDITNVIIPSCVTKIGIYAFAQSNIKEIIIPEGVNEIGDFAFNEANELISIVIPSTIEKIGPNTFFRCDNLKNVEIKENNFYSFKNNCIFEESTKTVLKGVDGASIPEDTIIIGFYAFYNIKLSDWTLPSSLKRIEDSSFKGTNITSIIIPESVEYLGSAFSFSTLEQIEILCNIETLSSSIFFECDYLKEVVLPSSVTLIAGGAFQRCDQLESVTLGNKIQKIVWDAFEGSENLKNVYFMGTLDEWNKIEFLNEFANPLIYADNFYIYVDGEFVPQY